MITFFDSENGYRALMQFCNMRKRRGIKFVFTNGCFDLLHCGHIQYLDEAMNQGNYLIVGINSDSSVKQLKGDNRPIIPELNRAKVIDALKSISCVTIFNDTRVDKLIRQIKPDVFVKGGDYTIDSIDDGEKNACLEVGTRIHIANMYEGESTSKIIERIKKIST